MNKKLLGIALFTLTLGAIVYLPTLDAKNMNTESAIIFVPNERPVVDVVFVLDTTGSMSGLIQTAKEKIWSIATTMASAQPMPDIRIGLVAYRDRGDAYVTRTVDLSNDLDSVYATLMDFQADGGGDGPESVNAALFDAVHNMSWSQADQAYQVIFLIGDAPPHMDYQDDVKYPAILASAAERGIVVNTIQCGNMPTTVTPWTQIASLGRGNFFQVEQSGGAVAYSTPFDDEIADLSASLDETRLYYGSTEEKDKMAAKVAATEKLESSASPASRARRGVFNASIAGKPNLLGENELVDAIASGTVTLAEIDSEALPESIKPMAPAEQEAYIVGLAEKRSELQRQIHALSADREGYLLKKVKEDGGRKDSLDQKLYDTVKEQGGRAGFEYEDGPAY